MHGCMDPEILIFSHLLSFFTKLNSNIFIMVSYRCRPKKSLFGNIHSTTFDNSRSRYDNPLDGVRYRCTDCSFSSTDFYYITLLVPAQTNEVSYHNIIIIIIMKHSVKISGSFFADPGLYLRCTILMSQVII